MGCWRILWLRFDLDKPDKWESKLNLPYEWSRSKDLVIGLFARSLIYIIHWIGPVSIILSNEIEIHNIKHMVSLSWLSPIKYFVGFIAKSSIIQQAKFQKKKKLQDNKITFPLMAFASQYSTNCTTHLHSPTRQ